MEDRMYNSWWKKYIGRGDNREKGQCKRDEKRRRKSGQGEIENQKHGGQAKRWSEWFEMCPMQSL